MSSNSEFDNFLGTPQRFFSATGVVISPLVIGKLSGFIPAAEFYTLGNGKKLFNTAVKNTDSSTQDAALHFLNELLMPSREAYISGSSNESGKNIINEIGPENFSKGLLDLVDTHEDEQVITGATKTINSGIKVSPQEIATTQTVHRVVDLACDPDARQDRREAAFEILRQAIVSNRDGIDTYVTQRLSASLDDLTKSAISDLAHNDRRILRDLCETLETVAACKPEMLENLIENNVPQRLAAVASNSKGEFFSFSVKHLAGVLSDVSHAPDRLARLEA